MLPHASGLKAGQCRHGLLCTQFKPTSVPARPQRCTVVQAEPDLKLLEKPLLKRPTLPSLPVEQARPESTQTQQQAQTTSNKQEQQQLRERDSVQQSNQNGRSQQSNQNGRSQQSNQNGRNQQSNQDGRPLQTNQNGSRRFGRSRDRRQGVNNRSHSQGTAQNNESKQTQQQQNRSTKTSQPTAMLQPSVEEAQKTSISEKIPDEGESVPRAREAASMPAAQTMPKPEAIEQPAPAVLQKPQRPPPTSPKPQPSITAVSKAERRPVLAQNRPAPAVKQPELRVEPPTLQAVAADEAVPGTASLQRPETSEQPAVETEQPAEAVESEDEQPTTSPQAVESQQPAAAASPPDLAGKEVQPPAERLTSSAGPDRPARAQRPEAPLAGLQRPSKPNPPSQQPASQQLPARTQARTTEASFQRPESRERPAQPASALSEPALGAAKQDEELPTTSLQGQQTAEQPAAAVALPEAADRDAVLQPKDVNKLEAVAQERSEPPDLNASQQAKQSRVGGRPPQRPTAAAKTESPVQPPEPAGPMPELLRPAKPKPPSRKAAPARREISDYELQAFRGRQSGQQNSSSGGGMPRLSPPQQPSFERGPSISQSPRRDGVPAVAQGAQRQQVVRPAEDDVALGPVPDIDVTSSIDEDVPELAAKPAWRRRPEKPSRDVDERAFRKRQPEMRVNELVRPADPSEAAEGRRLAQAWRERQQGGRSAKTGADAVPDPEKVAEAGKPRNSKTKRKEREKVDVEKQRSTRYERKQQRLELIKEQAVEQEEIFEVGAEGLAVGQLAEKLAVNPGDVLKTLFLAGIMAHVNQVLDKEMVKFVAEEYGVEVLDLEEAGIDDMARKTVDYSDEEDVELLLPRPPVVTVMGHVDHGKTSLLDYIRKTKVAAGEAGGITQAIGAYTCEVDAAEDQKKKITFLDTPGHEAFSAMRARGTKVTDIAIIVVACDDGVRPQTLEAISHAKAAKVPIVIALNKIDKEGANIEKAKQDMSEAGLLPEEWGGDTPMVPISAKKGLGIDDLLETVLLVAEVEDLTANPKRRARGNVVEAHLDRRAGPVATVLVATGTLRVGDVVHAGATFGKVRSMADSTGGQVEEAGPSIAVQLVGLNSVPVAGDEFAALPTEQEARKVATAIEESQRLSRLADQAGGSMVTSMTFATMDEDGDGLQHLNVVLKADASGAAEAVKGALLALPQDRVAVRFLMAAAGELTAGDVQLAKASMGHIIAFNLEPSESVLALAKQNGVAIKTYNVIYELIDDIRDLMEGKLGAIEERMPLGEAEVRAVFGSGSKKVAGCMVTEGLLRKGCLVVVTRGKRVVHEGALESLRRVKDRVAEVTNGNECGIGVEGFIEWKEGDKVAAFEVKTKRQTLEEASENQVVNSLTSSAEQEEYAAVA